MDGPRRFSWHDLEGEYFAGIPETELEAEVRRVLDPESATRTVHWGRNYIYETELATEGGQRLPVVVKQTRNHGWRRRLDRKLRGSKATRSWRVSRTLVEAGFHTPTPVLLAESTEPEGNSYFVAGLLEPAYEVRHFFRRLMGSPHAGDFPAVEPEEMLRRLGRLARRLHDAGIWYRDLSMGNVLVAPTDGGELDLYLIDFNRARTGCRLGIWRRSRDICRFPIVEREHQDVFLAAYWGEAPASLSPRRVLYMASVLAYILKHQIKNVLRGRKSDRNTAPDGRFPAHIPHADHSKSRRDRTEWDKLSDQPFQHASSVQKLLNRAADVPEHLGDLLTVLRMAPKIRRRYLALKKGLFTKPSRFDGLGIALMPSRDHASEHLDAVLELGVRHVLIRLQPWNVDIEGAEKLARRLVENGLEVVFDVPHNRDLVRDLKAWREAIESIAERFTPLGRHFVIGHAVNRSKWGLWTGSEYHALFTEAAKILRRYEGVEVLGPGVIDFEFHFTVGYLNRRDFFFDAVASLLYVDRRGAPENRHLGFDTVDKVVLLKAICDTARNCRPRSWITEVNWPLWEGPHSPAGRAVSVDEDTQANYLVRYMVLTLGTGMVERVYWWRLIARGYGLVVEEADGRLRRRPAYAAFQTLLQQLDGADFDGPVEAPEGVRLNLFRTATCFILVAWAVELPLEVHLASVPDRMVDRDGNTVGMPGPDIELGPSPIYLQFSSREGACCIR